MGPEQYMTEEEKRAWSVAVMPATHASVLASVIHRLGEERLLLAKLAADTTQFFGPLEATAAVVLRDRLLRQTPEPEKGD